MDGKELYLQKGPYHRRGGNTRALFSQDASLRNSFAKTGFVGVNPRNSMPYSHEQSPGHAPGASEGMSYDHNSAFEEWPDLH